ncbi:hypothetical protein C8R43DRAFT_961430 [Mycena crocata]|nr:hypothetical protein C8R43DRAFT_961430 [Mycena crocata]
MSYYPGNSQPPPPNHAVRSYCLEATPQGPPYYPSAAAYPPPVPAPGGHPGYDGYPAPPMMPAFPGPPPQSYSDYSSPGGFNVHPSYPAPPFSGPPSMPSSAAYMPAAPAFPAAPVEQPTVFYRGIEIHNPRYHTYPGGLSMDIYSTETRTTIQADINEIKNANEKELIQILTRLDALQMEVVAYNFKNPHNYKVETIGDFVKRKATGDTEKGLLALILGPLKYDADRIQHASSKDRVFCDVLLDLTPHDIDLLAYSLYPEQLGKPNANDGTPNANANDIRLARLSSDVVGRVDDKYVKKLFETKIKGKAQRSPAVPSVVDDVSSLYNAGEGRAGTNETKIIDILGDRPQDHLMKICEAYPKLPKNTKKHSLSKAIKKEFSIVSVSPSSSSTVSLLQSTCRSDAWRNVYSSSDIEKALLFIVEGAEKREDAKYSKLDMQAVRDAERLEATMKGAGTRDELLIMRVIRAHWSRPRMEQIKTAYSVLYKRTKYERITDHIKSDTSGTFQRLLIAVRTPEAGNEAQCDVGGIGHQRFTLWLCFAATIFAWNSFCFVDPA